MSTYSQGVYQDGAAILKDGKPMTIDEIVAASSCACTRNGTVRSIRSGLV